MTEFTFPALGAGGPLYQTRENLENEVRRAIGDESSARVAGAAALQAQVDAMSAGVLIVGLWDASLGAFPTTRPDGSPIKPGDTWQVSVGGTVGGEAFVALDRLIALSASGGATYAGNWIRANYSDVILGLSSALVTPIGGVEAALEDHLATGGVSLTAYASVASAVAAAYAAGAEIYAPSGTYAAASTVPNFHDVRWRGPGVIDAGGTLFSIEPRANEVNNLYVSDSGADTNDGLSPSRPFLTLDRALTVLETAWRKATDAGDWRITVSGTHRTTSYAEKLTTFGGRLTIQGETRAWIAHASGQAVEVGDYRTGSSAKMLYVAESRGITGATQLSQTYGTQSDGAVTWRHIGGFRDFAAGETITQDVSMRVSAGKVYLARSGGTTGATAPTHTSGVVTLDSVAWQYVGRELPIPPTEPTTVFDGSLDPRIWAAGAEVRLGDTRYNGANVYQALTAGTTGATPPTHGDGTASDDAITWRYIGPRTTNANGLCIWIEPDASIQVQDIRFRNWAKSGFNDYGVLLKNGRDMRVIRCVFDNCQIGSALIGGGGFARFYHNIYFNCNRSAWASYPTSHTIGSATQPCFFVGGLIGVFLSRSTVGHVDYCEFAGSDNHVSISLNARSNVMGCRFRGGDGAPLFTSAGGLVESGVPNHYFWGVPNMATSRPGNYARSSFGDVGVVGDAHIPQIFIRDTSLVTFTADVGTAGTPQIVRIAQDTKSLLPEWVLSAAHKPLTYEIYGSLTGSAGVKTLRAAILGNALAEFTTSSAADNGAFFMRVVATPRTNTINPQIYVRGALHINGVAPIIVNSVVSFDTVDAYGEPLAQTARLYATLSSGDACTLNMFDVWVEG